MKVFINVEVRRLFMVVCGILLAAGVTGLGLVRIMVENYKSMLISHDAALAGAFLDQELDPVFVAAVFATDKTQEQYDAGAQALALAGITKDTSYRFLDEVDDFAHRTRVATMIVTLFFSVALLAGLYAFELRQEKRIAQANRAIDHFMQASKHDGTRLALNDSAEGSHAQLFSAINGMAASLTAHLQKEQHDREFLKETISDISHQLKTPLAALQMYTEIIRNENTGNAVIENFAQKSRRELSRMEMLIQNLLKLARLDAGAIVLEKQHLPMNEFLGSIIERFSVRAEVEEKELHLVCSPGIRLNGDEHWLAEATGNLVKNALDHTTSGGQVNILCEETPLVVAIIVRDNGAGIHPDDLPHVFKRFYRSRFSKDRQGVGIGLTLARSIVEKHGGVITVESEPGEGAVFRMIFPKLTNL